MRASPSRATAIQKPVALPTTSDPLHPDGPARNVVTNVTLLSLSCATRTEMIAVVSPVWSMTNPWRMGSTTHLFG